MISCQYQNATYTSKGGLLPHLLRRSLLSTTLLHMMASKPIVYLGTGISKSEDKKHVIAFHLPVTFTTAQNISLISLLSHSLRLRLPVNIVTVGDREKFGQPFKYFCQSVRLSEFFLWPRSVQPHHHCKRAPRRYMSIHSLSTFILLHNFEYLNTEKRGLFHS